MCPLPPPKKKTNTGICCPGELPESYKTPRVVAHPIGHPLGKLQL